MRLRNWMIYAVIVPCLLACGAPCSAAVEIGGVITTDTTWTDSDTIVVTAEVTVSSVATLTIEAGVVCLFNPGVGLAVEGKLIAAGESYHRILFTSHGDSIGGAPLIGDWLGIKFLLDSDGLLHNCDLRYAEKGVTIYRCSPRISHCRIENFSHSGCYVDGYTVIPPITPTIEDCIIEQNDPAAMGLGNCIYLYRSVEVFISRCILRAGRTGIDAYSTPSGVPDLQVTNCEIRDNLWRGIYLHGM